MTTAASFTIMSVAETSKAKSSRMSLCWVGSRCESLKRVIFCGRLLILTTNASGGGYIFG
jgi:hypothetical protein